MNIEEKAKAYDEVLERVKPLYEWAKKDDSPMWSTYEYLFPQLAESEDERIRRELVEYLKGDLNDITTDDTDRWINWIEKQKDCFLIPKSHIDPIGEPGIDGMELLVKQKEPHFTKRNALFDKCVENCDPEVMKKVSDEIDDMLQKEQKPLEYLSKEKVYAIMTKLTELSASNLIPINSPEYLKIHQITKDVSSLLDYPIEQKPATWRGDDGMKPAEWSEEDRLHYTNVLEALEYVKGCKSDYDKIEAVKSDIAWFKSLRPQSHWKPTEGQMKALLKVVDKARELHYSSNSGYDEYDVLCSLYKQLEQIG